VFGVVGGLPLTFGARRAGIVAGGVSMEELRERDKSGSDSPGVLVRAVAAPWSLRSPSPPRADDAEIDRQASGAEAIRRPLICRSESRPPASPQYLRRTIAGTAVTAGVSHR
jgi:hypothetical protein